MFKFTLVEPVVRPRNAPGVHWGGNITVLARLGDKELWKCPGSQLSNRMSRYYVSGHITLVNNADKHWRNYTERSVDISDNGRASRALFQRQAKMINDFFGCEVADKLDPKKTLIVSEIEAV
jgi:hypothetical protein